MAILDLNSSRAWDIAWDTVEVAATLGMRRDVELPHLFILLAILALGLWALSIAWLAIRRDWGNAGKLLRFVYGATLVIIRGALASMLLMALSLVVLIVRALYFA